MQAEETAINISGNLIIRTNAATYGAGISLRSAGESVINDSVIIQNNYAQDGGGIFLS